MVPRVKRCCPSFRLVVIFFTAVLAVGAVLVAFTFSDSKNKLLAVFTGSREQVGSLDAQVEALETFHEAALDAWNQYKADQLPAPEAAAVLSDAYLHADDILSALEGVKLSRLALVGRGGFQIRKRNALDIARATATTLFALSTPVDFRLRLGWRNFGEGNESAKVAARLEKELKGLFEDYHAFKAQPGLDATPRPRSSATQYIFVILLDATRADHLSAYGYDKKTTPNIDKLAENGILFDWAFAQSALTDTSVASLMTGLYPRAHKKLGPGDWLWRKNLVERFRAAGFATGAFSANPLISVDGHYDFGFDHFEELFWNRATVVIGQAIRWFERAETTHEKVFVYIHLMDPHDLYLPPSPFFPLNPALRMKYTTYGLDKLIEFKFPDAARKDVKCAYDPTTENWGRPELLLACLSHVSNGVDLGKQDVASMIARYDGEVKYGDYEIGRLIKYLKKVDRLDNSIIVVLGDHGESFLEHNRLKHGHELYENQIHVPLIMWGASNRGRRASAPVEVIDVLPTLLELAGVGVPAGLHGRNLLGASPPDGRDVVYSLARNGRRVLSGAELELVAARGKRFKYIASFDRKGRELVNEEFYDLAADPGEMHDARELHRKEFDGLRDRVRQWNATTNTSAPRPVQGEVSETEMERLRALGYVQ